MTTAQEVIADYEAALSELTKNSKPTINMLTMLADDYVQHAPIIVQIIESHLEKVPNDQKLLTIYLIDSIVKNMAAENVSAYKHLFSKNLVKTFVGVYEKVDKTIRAKLFKVRRLWDGIFPASKLYGIDIKLGAVDPTWPIQQPTGGAAISAKSTNPTQGKAYVHPASTSKDAKLEPGRLLSGSATNANLEARKRQLQLLEQRKRELEEEQRRLTLQQETNVSSSHHSMAAPDQRDPRLSRGKITSLSQQCPQTSAASSSYPNSELEQFGSVESNGNGDPNHSQFQAVDSTSQNDAPSLPPKKRKPQSPVMDSELESSVVQEKRCRPDVVLGRDEMAPHFGTTNQDLGVMHRLSPQSFAKVKEEPMGGEKMVIAQATAAAISGLGDNPQCPRPIPTDVQHLLAASEEPAGSPAVPTPSTTGVPISIAAPADQSLNVPLSVATAPTQLRPSISASLITTTAPAVAQQPTLPAKSSNGNSDFDPIPSNNRIFVDGRAYEVKYIDDVAVIERNGLPHRIKFVGPPRDVVIDGTAHTLAFEESKTVTIDGQSHMLRFGAPSKELYIGPFPFRGSFGGPPISAQINGIPHKIQLCGPPPEVEIGHEPAHELLRYTRESHMARSGSAYDYGYGKRPVLMPSGLAIAPAQPIHTPVSTPLIAQPQPAMVQQSQVNVVDLYTKLVNAGIVGNMQQQQVKPITPPTLTTNRRFDEIVERRLLEPNLKDFAPGAMKIRYNSVIDSLYQEKCQCGACGMRFPDGDPEKYSKHLDWHFQQSQRDKDKSNGRSWYLATDDWIKYEEGDDPKTRSDVFESAQEGQQQPLVDESGHVLIMSTESVIPAIDDNQECTVCGEKFEQFWDEEEEVWKMRNAMLLRGKAYHPLCYQDVSSNDGESDVFNKITHMDCRKTAKVSLYNVKRV